MSKTNFIKLLSFVVGIFGLLFFTISCEYNGKSSSKVPPSEEIPTPSPPETDFKEHPKNVILLIGDGMAMSHITAAQIATKDKLALSQFKTLGFVKTYAADNLITDSGAGATAFSTGKKTYREGIGVSRDTTPLPTILQIAEQNDRATGMVVTSSLTHATPAAFIAHQPNRSMNEAIARDFLDTPIDLMMGGGRHYFKDRNDNKNLLDSLRRKGYTISKTVSEARQKSLPLTCFIADKHPNRVDEGRDGYLPKAVEVAVQKLSQNEKGFFLMVEGSQIDWGGHENKSDYIVNEMIDFDKAVQKALAYAKEDSNTLVIVTSDHECGGYSITGGSYNEQEVKGEFITDYHTASMVPLYAYGPGEAQFRGTQDNTAIFYKIKRAFNF